MGFDTTCYNAEDEHTVNELLTRRKEYKKKNGKREEWKKSLLNKQFR
jgi:hypothetical protein